MKNEKDCQNINYFFLFSQIFFFKWFVKHCPKVSVTIFLNLFIYIYIYLCKYYSDYTTYQLMQCKMFHHLYPFKVIELNTTPVKKKN